MKPLMIFPILSVCLIVSCNHQDENPSEASRSGAALENVPKAEIVFEGLMAFVETSKVDGKATTLDALLIDADNQPNSDPPKILEEGDIDDLHFPSHYPLVALQNGKLEAGCQFKGTVTKLYIPTNDDFAVLDAYPLCSAFECSSNPIGLRIGDGIPTMNLDLLVEKDDLIPDCQNPNFFNLDSHIEGELAARIRITNADTIEARVVPRLNGSEPMFGYRQFKNEKEYPEDKTCSDISAANGGTRRFAEEVVASGTGQLSLPVEGSGGCSVYAIDSSKPIRVRIFNIDPDYYAHPDSPGSALGHHEGFYWFYDIASTPCNSDGNVYPRPCEINIEAGYPKCPQPLIEGGD